MHRGEGQHRRATHRCRRRAAGREMTRRPRWPGRCARRSASSRRSHRRRGPGSGRRAPRRRSSRSARAGPPEPASRRRCRRVRSRRSRLSPRGRPIGSVVAQWAGAGDHVHSPAAGGGRGTARSAARVALFRAWVRMTPTCPTCGLVFGRVPGQWLGSWFLNVCLAQTVVVLILVLGVGFAWPDPPIVLISVAAGVAAVSGPLRLLPVVADPLARHRSRDATARVRRRRGPRLRVAGRPAAAPRGVRRRPRSGRLTGTGAEGAGRQAGGASAGGGVPTSTVNTRTWAASGASSRVPIRS